MIYIGIIIGFVAGFIASPFIMSALVVICGLHNEDGRGDWD